MAPLRYQYTPTPTDDQSLREKSWKSTVTTFVGNKEMKYKEGKRGKLSAWWNYTRKQDLDSTAKWMPLSMTTPILSAVIVASFLMVAGIEILAQKSQKQGGLALSPSLDQIPQYAMISSQYAPQVLAVLYSLFWSWIDLDIKRIQPWFQMSRPEGATAEDSLLLDYPYTFVAWVPFKAAQRRHWPVFLSGTAMVLVFWAITPLQSAQLGTGPVNLKESRHIVNRSRLTPLETQEALLGPEVLITGYSVAWLEQSLPPFMTASQAFMPFYVDNAAAPSNSGVNWTASTTELSTELDCWPAETSKRGPFQNSLFDFLDGQGCNATISIPGNKKETLFYVGYYDSPFGTSWLGNPACPPTENSTHQFLAIWATPLASAKGKTPGFDLYYDFEFNAMYCKPSYYKQDVIITVSADTLKPYLDTRKAVSDRETLSESEFNTTAFEFLLSNGMPEEMKDRDLPYSFQVEQHPRLDGFNLSHPVSTMVGFALAGETQSTVEFSDPNYLHDIFLRAHQYLFSIAVDRLLVNETNSVNQTATSTFPMHGIIVSRAISAALEALLLVVAVFTGILVWLCRKSPLNLKVNPSSISRVIEIFRDSPQPLDALCTVDNACEESIHESTSSEKFLLNWNTTRHRHEIVLQKGSIVEQRCERPKPKFQKGYYNPVRPVALRPGSGIAFVVAIIAIIVGLGYLKWAEVEFTGLTRPSQDKEVQQILENYIPTVLSTLIEPFWVLVNRLLCVLQPFKDLAIGNARAETSISATYSSIPPQFVALRAIKSRHFMLSVVCSAVFLSNILTVSLPAIFNERDISAKYPVNFTPQVATTFHNQSVFDFQGYLSNRTITTSSYQDHTYAALANTTSGTSLPPWVTTDFYFQPWDNTDRSNDSVADYYSLVTRGFGVETNCTSISPSTLPFDEKAEPENDYDNLNKTYCGDNLHMAATRIRRQQPSTPSTGPSALEYSSTSSYGRVARCDKTLTLGWARAPKVEDLNGTIEASFAICRPIFHTAMFEVKVDKEGYVQSYERISSLEPSLDYSQSDIHAEMMIAHANIIISMGAAPWHNDTLTRDWINHLLAEVRGSRTILDPNKPVPNPDDLIPDIDRIYRKLFSLLLGFQRSYLFDEPRGDQAVEAKRTVTEMRLFLDQPAFIITMVLLGFNIGVAALLYTRGVAFVLPRMPTSLGSIVAYFAPSRIVEEGESIRSLALQNKTFSFGRYLGRDGNTHVGIEMDPFVARIDPASLGKRAWTWFRLTKSRKHTRGSLQDGPWL